jgi:hypothetical protein
MTGMPLFGSGLDSGFATPAAAAGDTVSGEVWDPFGDAVSGEKT